MTSFLSSLTALSSTRYWGLLMIPSLLIGYGIINNNADAYLPLGVTGLLLGMIGFFMTIRSAYHRNRKSKKAALDERQLLVLMRASSYAFRGLAVLILLILLYGSFATQPERQWWFPRMSSEWRSLIMPTALILPLLPAIVAEWLEPSMDDEEI